MAKNRVVDSLFLILKKLLMIMKYVITLRWVFDIVGKLNTTYGKLIYNTHYFKHFSLIYKIVILATLIICLLLRYYKASQLKQVDSDNKSSTENLDKLDVKNALAENSNEYRNEIIFNNEFNTINKTSEERWQGKK
jgi:hypothetical protein